MALTSVNTSLLDLYVSHRVELEGWLDSVREDNKFWMKEHKKKVLTIYNGSQSTSVKRKKLDKLIRNEYFKLYQKKRQEFKELLRTERTFQADALKSVAPWYKVGTAEDIYEILEESFINPTLKEAYGGNSKREREYVNSSLSREANLNRDSIFAVQENNLNSVDSTFATHATSRVQEKTREANKDLTDSYSYQAVLDSRTTHICSSQDDREYDYNDPKRVMPPLHYNCRSVAVPIVKSHAELEANDRFYKSKFKKLTPSQIAELDGKSPATETYAQWLMRQNRSIQVKHLGSDEAVDMFLQGKLDIKKFVTPKGTAKSLRSVRQADFEATRTKPIVPLREPPELPVASNPRQLYGNEKQIANWVKDQSNNNTLELLNYQGVNRARMLDSKKKWNDLKADAWAVENSELKMRKWRALQSRDALDREMTRISTSKELTFADRNFLRDLQKEMEGRVNVNQQAAVLNSLEATIRGYRIKGEAWEDFTGILVGNLNRPNIGGIDRIGRTAFREKLRQDRLSRSLEGNQFFNKVFADGVEFGDLKVSPFNPKSWAGLKKTLNQLENESAEWFVKTDLVDRISADFKGIRKTKRGDIRTVQWLDKRTGKQISVQEDAFGNILNPEVFEELVPKKGLRGEALDRSIKLQQKRYIERGWISTPVNRLSRLDIRDDIAAALKSAVESDIDDYDQLANLIGKSIMKKRAPEIYGTPNLYRQIVDRATQFEGTPSQWHAVGDKILESMQRRGQIDIVHFNTSSPAAKVVNGVNTGKQNGTVQIASRSVEFLDGDILAQKQRIAKKKMIRDLGITRSDERLYAIEGEAYLFREPPAVARLKYKRNANGQLVRTTKQKRQQIQIEYGGRTYTATASRYGVIDPADIPVEAQRLGARSVKTVEIEVEIPAHTGILAHTSGINKPISKQAAASLNRKNSIERSLDQDFASFFTKAAEFDNASNPIGAHLVETNSFNRYQAIKYYQQNDIKWSNYYQAQETGRELGTGFLSPHAGEFFRPLIRSNKVRQINKDGYEALQQAFITRFDKVRLNTPAKRIAEFEKRQRDIDLLGQLVNDISKSDRPGPLLKILYSDKYHPKYKNASKMLHELDPEEWTPALRYAQEFNKIGNATTRRGFKRFADKNEVYKYKTDLAIEVDASESGNGIVATVTRNKVAMEKTNIIPGPEKIRIRERMAEIIYNDPAIRKSNLAFLNEKQIAKLAKDSVTTSVYGSPVSARSQRLSAELAKIINEEPGFFVLTAKNKAVIDIRLQRAIDKATPDEADLLTQLKKEIDFSVDNGVPISWTNYDIPNDLHPDIKNVLDNLSKTNVKVITPNDMKLFTQRTAESLDTILPSQKSYIDFQQEVVEEWFEQNPNATTMPFRAFDGHTGTVDFTEEVRYRTSFRDEFGRLQTREVITQGTRADIGKAKTAYPVLWVFSNDSGITRRISKRYNEGAIYDGFMVNVAETAKQVDEIRDIYIELLESDALLKNLQYMKSQGLSNNAYQKLLQRATDLGLIGRTDAANASDVLDSPHTFLGVDY